MSYLLIPVLDLEGKASKLVREKWGIRNISDGKEEGFKQNLEAFVYDSSEKILYLLIRGGALKSVSRYEGEGLVFSSCSELGEPEIFSYKDWNEVLTHLGFK